MYSRAMYYLVLVIVMTLSACMLDNVKNVKNRYTSEARAYYEAPHGLRKMFSKEEKTVTKIPGEGSISGGFFLFVGGLSGSYKEGTTIEHNVSFVRFAWEVVNSTYAITNIPLDKVRVRIVEEIKVPTVAFFLDERSLDHVYDGAHSLYAIDTIEKANEFYLLRNNYDAPEFLNKHQNFLKYIVISCNSSDWPQDITVPFD